MAKLIGWLHTERQFRERGGAPVSRLGHRYVITEANAWNVGVRVHAAAERNGEVRFYIYKTGGSHAASPEQLIAYVQPDGRVEFPLINRALAHLDGASCRDQDCEFAQVRDILEGLL